MNECDSCELLFETGEVIDNLKDDISEKHDLAASKPEKADELLKKIKLWRKKIGAKMPERNIKESL